MSEIQRYTPEPNYSNYLATSMANVALRKDFKGVVVLFTDHAKRVQELEEALREAKITEQDLRNALRRVAYEALDFYGANSEQIVQSKIEVELKISEQARAALRK